jgi:hypothetical protein
MRCTNKGTWAIYCSYCRTIATINNRGNCGSLVVRLIANWKFSLTYITTCEQGRCRSSAPPHREIDANTVYGYQVFTPGNITQVQTMMASLYHLRVLNTPGRRLLSTSVVRWKAPTQSDEGQGRKPEVTSHPSSKVRDPCLSLYAGLGPGPSCVNRIWVCHPTRCQRNRLSK